MLSGSPSATYLEQAADGCLFLPACMWRERNVKLILTESNEWKLHYEEAGLLGWFLGECSTCLCQPLGPNANAPGLAGMAIISAMGIPLYTVTSIAFAPLLAVGTCLKSVALSEDSFAKEYNQLVVDYLNEFPYDCEEKYVVEASNQKTKADKTKAINSEKLKQLNDNKSSLEKRCKELKDVQISASAQAFEESAQLLNDRQRSLTLEVNKIQREIAQLNEMDANHEATRKKNEEEFEVHNQHPLIMYVRNLNSVVD
jgi:hypothetical protein